MSGRDANQLAADVREWPAPSRYGSNGERTFIITESELEHLVALVGTLQQERDEAHRLFDEETQHLTAMERRAEALQQERDDLDGMLRASVIAHGEAIHRAEAAEAHAARWQAMCGYRKERQKAAEAALATTRQALAELLEDLEVLADDTRPVRRTATVNNLVLIRARRALAAAGGDTKEPA